MRRRRVRFFGCATCAAGRFCHHRALEPECRQCIKGTREGVWWRRAVRWLQGLVDEFQARVAEEKR